MTTHRLASATTRTIVWAVVVAALAYVGRQTLAGDYSGAMTWPAAGAATLWIGTSRGWWQVVDLLALAATTWLVGVVSGFPLEALPFLTVANVAQAGIVVILLRQATPHLWGVGGTAALHTSSEVWFLTVAALGSTFVGALIGPSWTLVNGGAWDPADALSWWGRNGAGTLAVVALAMLVRRPLDGAASSASTANAASSGATVLQRCRVLGAAAATGGGRLFRERGVEFTALVLASIFMYWALFGRNTDLPITFPLMLLTVWAGVRFEPIVVHLHSITVSAAVVILTLNGYGPFSAIESTQTQALIAQLFISLTIVFGLSLAVGHGERDELLEQVGRAEQAASRQATRLATLVDQMDDGVALVDGDGNVVLSNPAGQRVLSVLMNRRTPENPDGDCELVDANGQLLAGDEHFFAAIAQGYSFTQDVVVRYLDGEQPDQVLHVSVHPSDGDDGTRQALVVYRDVTDERRHLASVESFAAVVAHDLNAPLTVIDGWTEVLLAELGGTTQVAAQDAVPMLTRVQSAAGSMRELIRDLLAFSQSRDENVNPEPVNLTLVAQTAAALRVEAFAQAPSQQRPRISVETMPMVMGESVLVRQLIDNLLGNSIKYARAGEPAQVHIAARRVDQWVEVSVSDHGVGIPLGQQAHVFDAFFRAHTGYAGHGLGLAICKRIVERYGGTIRVRDNPDATSGTRVYFTLPAVPAKMSGADNL